TQSPDTAPPHPSHSKPTLYHPIAANFGLPLQFAITCMPYSTPSRAEELIGRGVTHAHLLRHMVCVTAGCRPDSALGVRPADKSSIRKDTVPLMGFGAQQEPLNCTSLRRIGLLNNLADDRGTIGHLPGRTGKVSADLPALLVEEICLRGRESPLEEAVFSFAGIDLNAVRRCFKQQRGALRRYYPGLVSIGGRSK